jgi:hypothetical protein
MGGELRRVPDGSADASADFLVGDNRGSSNCFGTVRGRLDFGFDASSCEAPGREMRGA